MAGNLPEHRIDRPLLVMRWEDVAFLHWAYDPAVVQRLLPSGLAVDVRDGQAWVGLVAFRMADVRAPGAPALPGLSTFPEINVRTYVRAPDGSDGLWFLTLEASRAAMMTARPLIGIAYTWARMAVTRRGSEVRYDSRRRLPRDPSARTRLGVEFGVAIPPGEQTGLDHHLTGRWRAYSRRHDTIFCTPVEHEPWPLHRAAVTQLDDGLVAACGLPQPSDAPLVHYAPAVGVSLGVPRVVA